MADVHLFQTNDGGEITITAGRVELDRGPATAAYISLFGGNEADDGSTATDAKQWWGNLIENDRARHVRSETQSLLRMLPAVTSNVPRIEAAVERDLAWITTELGAQVEADVTMPALNTIKIEVSITIDAQKTELEFIEPWGSE